jgi:hypothetical protein
MNTSYPAFVIVETEDSYSVLGTAKDEAEARSLILLHASGYVDFLDAQNDKFYVAPIPEPRTLKLEII